MTERATPSEKAKRLDEIAQAMLEHGCWNGRIESAFAERWGVTRRQVRNYTAEARALIRDELDEQEQDRAERRRMFVARLRAGQREMHRDRNWGAWVKAMQLESSIVAAASAEPSGDGELDQPMTVEELIETMRALGPAFVEAAQAMGWKRGDGP